MLLAILAVLIGIPLALVVFTPVVLIAALFRSGRYFTNVAAGYRRVCLDMASGLF